MSDLIFSVKGSVSAELKRFKAISSSDPARGKQIYANGEKLIVLAGSGELNQFKKVAAEIDREDILSYFSAKALMASLIGGHLVLTGYILDNGYPLQLSVGLPNVLNDCLRELCDYECVSIVKLFIEKGQDVNKQEQGTWLAPLHIAVKRELVDTIEQLVSAGADVNIVGDGDVMPLTLAQQLPDSSSEKQRIVDFLSSRGARTTWRRQDYSASGTNANNTYFSTEFTSNTQIKAGPANSAKPVVHPNAGPGAPAAGEKVRFNGSQLGTLCAVPTASAGNKKVSFNGASLVLEQVTLPTPPPSAAPRTSAPDLALPKVSVATASGERLLPPQKALVAAGAGAGEEAAAATLTDGSAGVAESAVADVSAIDRTDADIEAVCDSLTRAVDLNGAGSVEQGPHGVVGAFQMSEDGAAMLFSTG